VDFVQQGAATIYPPAVLARYDVLGFDPRGIARCDPATCFPTAADDLASPLLRFRYPLPGPEEEEFTLDSLSIAERCQTQSPERFSHASTANVARDMDLLRQRWASRGWTTSATATAPTSARRTPGCSRTESVGSCSTAPSIRSPGAAPAAGTRRRRSPWGSACARGIGAHETFGEFPRVCREVDFQHCSLAALGDPAVIVPAAFDRLAASPSTSCCPTAP
jgi:hypothetical protein